MNMKIAIAIMTLGICGGCISPNIPNDIENPEAFKAGYKAVEMYLVSKPISPEAAFYAETAYKVLSYLCETNQPPTDSVISEYLDSLCISEQQQAVILVFVRRIIVTLPDGTELNTSVVHDIYAGVEMARFDYGLTE